MINELDHLTPDVWQDFQLNKASARFHFVNGAETIEQVSFYRERDFSGIIVSYSNSSDKRTYRSRPRRKLRRVESLGVRPIFGSGELFEKFSD